jgi:hypothetical protein
MTRAEEIATPRRLASSSATPSALLLPPLGPLALASPTTRLSRPLARLVTRPPTAEDMIRLPVGHDMMVVLRDPTMRRPLTLLPHGAD